MAEEITGLVEEGKLLEALDLVQNAHAAYSLVVSDGVSERVFYFAIGGLRLIRSGPRTSPSVGELLTEQGLLPANDYQQLLGMVEGDDLKALAIAMEQGVVTEDEYRTALKRKLEEDMLDLFIWEGAEVRLMAGQPSEEFYSRGHESASLSYDVPAFIGGVRVQLDALSGGLRRISTGKEIYEVADRALASQRNLGEYEFLLDALDGAQTLSAAIRATGLRRVPCHRLVQRLLQDGIVRRLAGTAAAKASREHFLKEAAALEDALGVSLAPHIVRARLARALESAGEKSRAAEQWRTLGDSFRRANDLEKSLENFKRCTRLLPTDFATRELILEIHRHQRNYRQLVSEGRPLAETFLKHNLLGRAKTLLLQLVGYEPKDPGLRRQLIMVLIGLGDTQLALEHLWELAKVLEERGATDQQLRDVYLRILALDKTDRAARKRLEDVTGVATQRRAVRMVIGATGALLLALGGVFAYEHHARDEIRQAMLEAETYLSLGDYENARDILQQSLARFKYASASSGAERMMTLIDELERELMRRQAKADGIGDNGLSPEAKAAAEELAYKASQLLENGSLEEGHRVYRELFELYPWAEALDTAEMPLQITVLPRDAKVFLNGEEMGQGDLALNYSPRAQATLVVEREGFEEFRLVLDGPQKYALGVSLSKPVRWTFQSDAPFESPPAVVGDSIYLSGRDRNLTSLSTRDGSPRWRKPLGLYADAAVTPVRTDAGVVVATAVGEAICVTPVTGDVAWRRSLGVGVDQQPVAARADAVVFPGRDGSMTSVNTADGKTEWSTPPGTLKAGGPTVLANYRIAFVDQAGSLSMAAPEDGTIEKTQSGPAGLTSTPIFDGERIWAWAGDSTVRSFSSDSTLPLKRYPAPKSSGLAPLTVGDRAYVLGTDGRVMAFRAEGGMLFPPVALPEKPSAPPAYSDGRVYVPGENGGLYVLDAELGDLLWKFDAGSRITAVPVVRGGTIYVVTEQGTLHAVTE